MRIEDYAVIGDTSTAALVGRDGSIDWLCLPRFDSAACFAKLLGDDGNGRWLVAPRDEPVAVRRRYRPHTMVLETEFETSTGTVRVIDFMPIRDEHADIVRIVEGVGGEVAMRMELVVRFDYGSVVPWVRRADGGIVAIAGPDALYLKTDVDFHGEDLTTVADFTVRAGERVPFTLAWDVSHHAPPVLLDPYEQLVETERFWADWAARSTYDGKYPEAVERSLLVLKSLTYRPTGGIVAAPTTSLPEHLGGERNWDYRYCWLRDATFTLQALMVAGYTEEASAWREWLLRAVAGSPGDARIMYGPAGERRLPEWEVPWLSGYEGSLPVRVGNAAADQLQIDVFGEVMDTLHQARREGLATSDASWEMQRALMQRLVEVWDQPDDGIWEVRGGRRHFTHSKVMAWVALDRAVKAVEQWGRPGPVAQWREVRDRIHREVCARGWNDERGSFVQSYGGTALDASLLLIPLVGFLPADDERVRRTIAAIERELCEDALVLRYRTEQVNDGLSGDEGAFVACSFWLADCYALAGRTDDATELFERLLSLRNDVGLLAEQYDPRLGRQLGNFPQAFSHVALVNTAYQLSPSCARHAVRSDEAVAAVTADN